MEGIEKIMNSVKVMRFKKDDILIVKLKKLYNNQQLSMLRDHILSIVPKDLNIKVVMSNPDIDFEILRRNTKECTQVIASETSSDNNDGVEKHVTS